MLWIAAVVGGGLGIFTLVAVMPFLRKRIVAAEADADHRCAAGVGSVRCTGFLLSLCAGRGGRGERRPPVRGRGRVCAVHGFWLSLCAGRGGGGRGRPPVRGRSRVFAVRAPPTAPLRWEGRQR